MNLSQFLNSNIDGVFYLGHASIIVRLNSRNYLFDYIKNSKPYGDSWKFFPSLVSLDDLKSFHGVFVSHLHQDHLDLNFLNEVQMICPVYIIDGRPDFNQILKKSDINFIKIPPNKKIHLEEDIFVYGILHETNGIDSSCVIANHNFSVYHGNDNYCSLGAIRGIKDTFGEIDVACIPYAYINWYPQLLRGVSEDFRKSESDRLVNQYFEIAMKYANELSAKQVIPFGANLVYFDNAYSALNLECKTPPEFESYVKKNYGDEVSQYFRAFLPGDLIIKNNSGNLEILQSKKIDPITYRKEMNNFLANLNNNSIDSPEPISINNLVLNDLEKRIKVNLNDYFDHKILITSPSLKPKAICIDLKNVTVQLVNEDLISNEHADLSIIITTDSLLNSWIKSDIRLEEIINARKFTLERKPNIYRPDILRVINTLL